MKYKTLLFDADGTLLDFHRSETEALANAMRQSGIEPSKEKADTYSRINKSLWEMLERGEIEKQVLLYRRFELFLEAIGSDADAVKMANDYMRELSVRGYVFGGVVGMCERLSRVADLYIVTNGVKFIQSGRYKHCGLDKYFKGVFISDDIGIEKPNVEYFDHVSAHIDGFNKESALIIGDSLTSDIKGGINYGIDTCWYAPNGKEAPADMNITCVARSFDDVEKFILGVN